MRVTEEFEFPDFIKHLGYGNMSELKERRFFQLKLPIHRAEDGMFHMSYHNPSITCIIAEGSTRLEVTRRFMDRFISEQKRGVIEVCSKKEFVEAWGEKNLNDIQALNSSQTEQ